MAKFQKGDKVKLLENPTDQPEEQHMVGQIYTVTGHREYVDTDGTTNLEYYLDDEVYFVYAENWLEKVE